MLYNLLRYIKKERFHCITCCYKGNGEVIRLVKRSGTKVIVLIRGENTRQQLEKIVRKYDIRIVYVNTYKLLREAAILRNSCPAVIYHMHHLVAYTHHKLTKKKKEKILKTIVCVSDKIIACSNIVKKQFDFIQPQVHIKTVYNGVEISSISRKETTKGILRSEYGILPGERIVAVVGRIGPQKGQQLFIRACHKVMACYDNVTFFIIGFSPSPRFLRFFHREIKQLCLDKKMFLTGFRYDIPEIMRDIDILVLPSAYEAFNVSLLEGMAAGKAVIATRTGGTPELIQNGKNGILVKPHNVENLSMAILYLLKNDSQRKLLGKRARQAIHAGYTIRSHVRKIEKNLLAMAV